jgi:hypothetical protein
MGYLKNGSCFLTPPKDAVLAFPNILPSLGCKPVEELSPIAEFASLESVQEFIGAHGIGSLENLAFALESFEPRPSQGGLIENGFLQGLKYLYLGVFRLDG